MFITGSWGDIRRATGASRRGPPASDGLLRAALGQSATDPDAVALVSAMLEPVVFGDLRARGASTATAADLITDVLCAWLEPRERRLRR